MQADTDIVIAIPTLDEADHIGAVLDGLLADGIAHPILILDGGSRDGTRRIARRYAGRHANISLIDNPERSQAAALNRAAALAQGQGAQVLVRMDAHARYPAGFVAGLTARLRQTGADSVTVPLIAEGRGFWQRAAAALQRSWLGNGGAPHRAGCRGGWVDHGHHAAFRLSRFRALGGYDTRFLANEDAEFDLRLVSAGGRIFLDTGLAVLYRPRATPRALWRQMRRNGRWRAETALKHRRPPGLRQILPVTAALMLAGSAAGGLLLAPAAALPGAGYLATVLALSLHAGGLRLWPAVALLAVLSHTGFAAGALGRLVRPARPRLRAVSAELSRQGA